VKRLILLVVGLLVFGLLKGAGTLIKNAILDESEYWEPKVARVLIRIAARFVPSRRAEWHAELDLLQGNGKACTSDGGSHSGIGDPVVPGVTWALGVLCTAPLTGLMARVRRLHARGRSQLVVGSGGLGTAVVARTGAAALMIVAGAVTVVVVYSSNIPRVPSIPLQAATVDTYPCGPQFTENDDTTQHKVQRCPLVQGDVPVYDSPDRGNAARQVGKLSGGDTVNWFVAQSYRSDYTSGPNVNHWWAFTLSDKDASGNSHWGWVSETFFKGGANDERDAGLFDCDTHGNICRS
jgi:hypothetical protein